MKKQSSKDEERKKEREREKDGKSQRVSERERKKERVREKDGKSERESERGDVSCTKCFTTGDPWDHFLKKFHKKLDNILREQQDLF